MERGQVTLKQRLGLLRLGGGETEWEMKQKKIQVVPEPQGLS